MNANAALLAGLRKLPEKIMQIDSFADIEELTFPLLDPTEEDQNEWFSEFCRHMRDYVEGCIEDLTEQYDTAQPTAPEQENYTAYHCIHCDGTGEIYDLDTKEFRECEPCEGTGDADKVEDAQEVTAQGEDTP